MHQSLIDFYSFALAEHSNCDDIEYSIQNEVVDDFWLVSEVWYSYDACNGPKDSKLLISS